MFVKLQPYLIVSKACNLPTGRQARCTRNLIFHLGVQASCTPYRLDRLVIAFTDAYVETMYGTK